MSVDDLVTVIVPVYNAHKYLDHCVDSIISQTYTNLQVILVNDGSTDGSGDICDAYARQDTRVELVHLKNSGVSAARNAGLDRARGAWIAFADADDYVSEYYIEEMLSAAIRDSCDMVICRNVRVWEDSDECVVFSRTRSSRCITGREACIERYTTNADIYIASWGKLFRICLWTLLRFPEGRYVDDIFLSHALLYHAGSVTILDAMLYAYVQTSGSLMRSAFTPRRLDALDALQESVHFFKAAGDSGLANIALRLYCSRVFDARYICKKRIPHEREALRKLRQRAKDAYTEVKPIREYIACSKRKALAYRAMLFLGRWCPPLYVFIFVRRSLWRGDI